MSIRTLILLLVLSLGIGPAVQAAYDRVVSWSDMSDLDLSSVLRSQYASQGNLFGAQLGTSAVDVALRDADGRINPEFHVPPALHNSVEFWLKIYTLYTTQHIVLFDSRHPEIVYEVLDFQDLAKTSRNAVVYEILRDRKLHATLKAYSAAFARLSSKKARKHTATAEELKIIAALKHSKHKHSYHELAGNLRSQRGQRDNVVKGLLAAEAYFPRMEKVFQSMGVPPELTRLSLVESSFDLRAYSRVGAVGVWQFMPAPGKKLMLIDENNGIDERLSPLKSSVAAAQMLKENYVQFRNWSLTVTSYNHGLRGLMKYRRSRSDRAFREVAHLFDPCSKESPLGWAGRNYYAEFLAMLHAESYRQLFYGDAPSVNITPVAYRQLEKGQTAQNFAKTNGISLPLLKQANPDIRNFNGHLPHGFWIAVPGQREDLAGLTQKHPSKAVTLVRASRKSRRA